MNKAYASLLVATALTTVLIGTSGLAHADDSQMDVTLRINFEKGEEHLVRKTPSMAIFTSTGFSAKGQQELFSGGVSYLKKEITQDKPSELMISVGKNGMMANMPLVPSGKGEMPKFHNAELTLNPPSLCYQYSAEDREHLARLEKERISAAIPQAVQNLVRGTILREHIDQANKFVITEVNKVRSDEMDDCLMASADQKGFVLKHGAYTIEVQGHFVIKDRDLDFLEENKIAKTAD